MTKSTTQSMAKSLFSNIKVFAFDIDGTILNSNQKISKANLKAIKVAKKHQYKIIFCSGRPYVDMEFLQSKYQIADFIICNNGTYWYDVKTQQFHFQNTLDGNLSLEIIEEAKATCALLALHTNNGTFRSQLCNQQYAPEWLKAALKEEAQLFFDKYRSPLDQTLNYLKTAKITQVAFHLQANQAKKLAAKLIEKYGTLVNIAIANERYVDINPKYINKFVGLTNVANYLKIDTSQIVAFGDSGNDLEMLANVGYGICMSNGTKEAQAVAKEVIGSNDSDDISLKIYEIIGDRVKEIE